MEHEAVNLKNDGLEDGEVVDSDEDCIYTPLQRPILNANQLKEMVHNKPVKMEGIVDNNDESPLEFGLSSDSSSDSDDVNKINCDPQNRVKKKMQKRTVLLRVKPLFHDKNEKFQKYDIWTASLQEESITENMREIGVNKYSKQDRQAESYDFTWKYRLEKSGGFKRRLSDSGDDVSEKIKVKRKTKRARKNPRKSGIQFAGRGGEDSTSSCDSQNFSRYITDLNIGPEGDCAELARDLANKLFEEKDDLILRAIEIIGKEKAISIFKETQNIEKDGGMMIQNGQRRRTPGGVFLFLLKQDNEITAEDKKKIFEESIKKSVRERKSNQNSKRDKKVEELKKQLNMKESELKALTTRTELAINSHLKVDDQSNLSNPPPSPVANSGLENSPDYTAHAINHEYEPGPEKGQLKHMINKDELVSYDDDILDVNYDEMDLF